MRFTLLALAALMLPACGPTGQIATPSQNVVRQFEFRATYYPKWQWTVPGSVAILSLEKEQHELVWAIREKSDSNRRRTNFPSLLLEPYFPNEGPRGLTDVRFSPSGKTILIHEFSPDGRRSQTLVFVNEPVMNTWSVNRVDLTEPGKVKMRKLDDGTRVPAIVSNPVPPRILRLDDDVVIFENDGKTRSVAF